MAGILAIEYVLPEYKLSNEELADVYQVWTAEKISKKTGINERRIAGEKETAVDLGVAAAEKLFDSRIIDREEVGFVLFVTQSPDYILPTSACIIQERLRLSKNCGAFDINLGCSGFVYGLAAAKGLVESGIAGKVLLITAETYSKHINPLDRSTRTIFGDGAAAALIGGGGMKIGSFALGTDGTGRDLLMIPSGGMRTPRSKETSKEKNAGGNIRSGEQLFMDGTGIFEFTIREVPKNVEQILQKEGLTNQEIDLFIFHQANKFMLDYLRKTMNIEKDRFYMNFSDIGNTVSATIPIAMKRALDEKIIGRGQNILLCGFGVGLSWGSTIIKTGDYVGERV